MSPGERLAKLELETLRRVARAGLGFREDSFEVDAATPRDEVRAMLDDCLRTCTMSGAPFTPSEVDFLGRVQNKLRTSTPFYRVETSMLRTLWDRLAAQTVRALSSGVVCSCPGYSSNEGPLCDECIRRAG